MAHGGKPCHARSPQQPNSETLRVPDAIRPQELRPNGSNRRMRSRMSGGVGGAAGAILPPRPDPRLPIGELNPLRRRIRSTIVRESDPAPFVRPVRPERTVHLTGKEAFANRQGTDVSENSRLRLEPRRLVGGLRRFREKAVQERSDGAERRNRSCGCHAAEGDAKQEKRQPSAPTPPGKGSRDRESGESMRAQASHGELIYLWKIDSNSPMTGNDNGF